MNALGVIIACGKEEEVKAGADAAFLTLGNVPVLAHTLKTFEAASAIDGVILAVAKDRVDSAVQIIKRYGCSKVVGVVVGGVNRLSTLRTVFSKMPVSPAIIVIHEASRPFVVKNVLAETVKSAKRYGCAIAAHKLPDAAKLAPKGVKAAKTLERNSVWSAQTPQAFKTEVLKKIVESKAAGIKIQDDESEHVRKPTEVHMVEAGERNMKIRSSSDLAVATALLNAKLV